MVRVPLPKKVRFEVFKRDKFTCQYCGANAPEAVLHVDHIHPIAEGGSDDILNLVTSCFACNNGKGARLLSDSGEITKQHAALSELEERRQQLEWLMAWRDELQRLAGDTVDHLVRKIVERGKFEPNENGRLNLKNWLKKYSFEELLRAIDESFDTYLKFSGDAPTVDSWEIAFAKIPGVAGILRQQGERPYLRHLLYIQGIIRRRSGAKRYQCVEYLEHLHVCGADLDEMERRAKAMRQIVDFEGPYDEWLESIGRPY